MKQHFSAFGRGRATPFIGGNAQSAAYGTTLDGGIVLPRLVDIHTHLDAQLAWDPVGTVSCWHGVTTVMLAMSLAGRTSSDGPWPCSADTGSSQITTGIALAKRLIRCCGRWNTKSHRRWLKQRRVGLPLGTVA